MFWLKRLCDLVWELWVIITNNSNMQVFDQWGKSAESLYNKIETGCFLLAKQESPLSPVMFIVIIIIAIIVILHAPASLMILIIVSKGRSLQVQWLDWKHTNSTNTHTHTRRRKLYSTRELWVMNQAATEVMDLRGVYEQLARTLMERPSPQRQWVKSMTQWLGD